MSKAWYGNYNNQVTELGGGNNTPYDIASGINWKSKKIGTLICSPYTVNNCWGGGTYKIYGAYFSPVLSEDEYYSTILSSSYFTIYNGGCTISVSSSSVASSSQSYNFTVNVIHLDGKIV